MTVQPRHVVCVLHDGHTPVESISTRFAGFEYDTEYSLSEPDPRMVSAFRLSADRVVPSLVADDWTAIEAHKAVSYVLSPPMTASDAMETSQRLLSFVAEVLRAGALAVKGESSGIAHGRDRWLELEQGLRESPESSLFRAWVRYPITSKKMSYSVGMHLLGLRDIEIDSSVLAEGEAADLIGGFAHFLLIDKPTDLQPGHTFRLETGAGRFRLAHADCLRYPRDDFFYNPFGYWRLEPAGSPTGA